MDRNLDGIYFRIKRNERWGSVCLSDMTKEELKNVLKERNKEYLISVCETLAGTIKRIGNSLDINVKQ